MTGGRASEPRDRPPRSWSPSAPATSAAGTPATTSSTTSTGRAGSGAPGSGRVTVRFETAETGPGPVRTFAEDDPALHRREPVPARLRSRRHAGRNLTASPGRSCAQRSRSAASHHRDDRVAAGRRVVAQEHQRAGRRRAPGPRRARGPRSAARSVRARSSRGPSSRTPTRSASAATVYDEPRQRARALVDEPVGPRARDDPQRHGPPGTAAVGTAGAPGRRPARADRRERPDRQHVARGQRRRAEPRQGVGGARAQHRRDPDAAGHGHVEPGRRRRRDPAPAWPRPAR